MNFRVITHKYAGRLRVIWSFFTYYFATHNYANYLCVFWRFFTKFLQRVNTHNVRVFYSPGAPPL